MTLFGRNAGASQVIVPVPVSKLEEIFAQGELVCSFTATDPVSRSRQERRVVRFMGTFYLMRILHEAIREPTGRWFAWSTVSGFGATHTLDEKPDENDKFFAWQDIRLETRFQGKFESPVIEWATTSLDQFKKDERAHIEDWKKRSR